MASSVDLDRVGRNDDRLSTLQLILSGAVDLNALKEVLRVNTKVSEVIIYVDESFLVDLPVAKTMELFGCIGAMPNLSKLGFHSQSGSSGVLSIPALIAITSHATRMVHFGISDVALWGTQEDFCEWATQLQSQLFLQSFCVCECELLQTNDMIHAASAAANTKECPLDPLLTVMSILPSLEALFLQAATPNALGRVSPEAVGSIGMAPQLLDLRLGNFELRSAHMEQLATVLPYNKVITELKLDACHDSTVATATAMARILKHNTKLKSFELGLMSMMCDEGCAIVAQSLHYNPSLESFTLSRGANARFRPSISKACQQAFVEMLHQNYALETLVLFQRFPVKKEFKLYLTLNKYGRGKLLMSHSTQREQWIQAIHKVNDDLDSIFYYMSINPSLCNHCHDDEEDDDDDEDPEEEELQEEELQEDDMLAALVAAYGPADAKALFQTLERTRYAVGSNKRSRAHLQEQLLQHEALAGIRASSQHSPCQGSEASAAAAVIPSSPTSSSASAEAALSSTSLYMAAAQKRLRTFEPVVPSAVAAVSSHHNVGLAPIGVTDNNGSIINQAALHLYQQQQERQFNQQQHHHYNHQQQSYQQQQQQQHHLPLQHFAPPVAPLQAFQQHHHDYQQQQHHHHLPPTMQRQQQQQHFLQQQQQQQVPIYQQYQQLQLQPQLQLQQQLAFSMQDFQNLAAGLGDVGAGGFFGAGGFDGGAGGFGAGGPRM